VDDVGYFIPGYEPASLDDRQADLEARTRRDCAALALR